MAMVAVGSKPLVMPSRRPLPLLLAVAGLAMNAASAHGAMAISFANVVEVISVMDVASNNMVFENTRVPGLVSITVPRFVAASAVPAPSASTGRFASSSAAMAAAVTTRSLDAQTAGGIGESAGVPMSNAPAGTVRGDMAISVVVSRKGSDGADGLRAASPTTTAGSGRAPESSSNEPNRITVVFN